jgi:glycerophosphoryl diester phosphodiesterase
MTAIPFFDRWASRPLIIAHRGYRACYPENTLCAFAHSLGRSDMIELDVQLSADGVAVVFHDDSLTRTSNAASVAAELGLTSLALRDWQLASLRRLDIGSWFLVADPFGAIHHEMVDRRQLIECMPQQMQTLHEVLRWAAENRMPLNIEIKDMFHPGRNDALAAAVVHDLRATVARNLAIVSSFNPDILRTCRQMAPEMATAALCESAHPPDLVAFLRSLGVHAYHPADAITDAPLVRTLHAAGLHVNVFTVNDPARQRELVGFGVTGIFTDFPDRGQAHSF